MQQCGDTAYLSNHGSYTDFSFGDERIRFRTPDCLERYLRIKEWDKGYIVASALYRGIGETEEYIDLLPILKNLFIPAEFLKPIKKVEVLYDR